MAFNINQFIGELSSGGTVKTNLYDVIISRNGKPDIQIERQIAMRAENFTVPGRSANFSEIAYSGPTIKVGTDSHYEQTSLTIILSEDQSEREYFEEWLDMITGNLRTEGANVQTAYTIGYYDEYVGTVRINMFNETEEQTYSYELVNAWPVSIGEIELSYDDVQVAKMTVTFAFHYYRTEKS